MKPGKQNKIDEGGRKSDESGQMILLAGFLVAVALIGLAVVVGSAFYSQSSPDDTGLSQLSAQVSDQIETAEDVGLQNIVKGNENATEFEGLNETEICSQLGDVTAEEVRDQIALSEDEVLLDITLVSDCDQFNGSSYAMGQQNDTALPGVTVADPVEEEGEEFLCEELRGENYTCLEDNREEFHDALINVIENRDDGPYPDENTVPDNYGEPAEFEYTEDKIWAMNNVSGIELDDLPGEINETKFAETCVDVSIEQEELPDCSEIRNITNLNDSGVSGEFQDELIGVVMNETPGDGIPSDYNESNESTDYEYTEHKIQALENTENDTALNISAIEADEALSDEIDENDSEPVDLLAECVQAEVPGEAYDCEELRGDEWLDLDEEAFLSNLTSVVESRESSYGGGDYEYVDEDIVPQEPEYNESENEDAYDYTQDKVDALENMDSVDLEEDLPDRIEPEEFADCLSPSLGGESFTCEDIRNDSGYTDNIDDFRENLRGVILDDLGEIPPDYNETDPDGGDYDYEEHKIEAFEETDGITRDDIEDITGLDQYDDAFEALADCIEIQELGRPPADVVFSIDTTGSMGFDRFTEIDENYNANANHPTFSLSEVETPRTQRHQAEYTTETGRTYTRPDPWSVDCYKEYPETGVEFPNIENPTYGDEDLANQNWCEGAFLGDSFTASGGEVGDFVWDGSELLQVIDIPPAPTPPPGIPEDWERLTTPGVDTGDESNYPVGEPNDCSDTDCETRNVNDPVNVGDVVEYLGGGAGNYPNTGETVEVIGEVTEFEVDNSGLSTENVDTIPGEPVTAEVTGFVESNRCVETTFIFCTETDDVWQVEHSGNTYEIREDAIDPNPDVDYEVTDGSGTTGYAEESELEFFEYRWDEPPVQVEVEDEFGSTDMVETDDLNYVEYRWWTPDRLFLTQTGARAALDDLVAGEDRAGLVRYSTAQSGNADTVQGLDTIDSGYRDTLREEIDLLRPASGTDITSGIQEARTVLETDVCEGDADRSADCHIVLMTDGQHNTGEDPESYIVGNTDYEDIYVHGVALGSAADEDTMETVANPDGSDSVRPEGLFRASNDPEDAEDIFEDIVDEIQDTGEADIDANETEDEFVLPNETLDTPGVEFNTSDELETGIGNISLPSQDNVSTGEVGDENIETNLTASGGAVEEIYELNMNVTSFKGDGPNEYMIGLTDAEDGVEDTIWSMTIEINPEDADGDPLQDNGDEVETQIRFESDIDDSLTEEFNSTANLSKTEDVGYVNMDLVEQEFELYDGDDVVYEHPGDYNMTEAFELVNEEASGDGETGDGIAVTAGPDDEVGSANGTFALDLMPVDGNFSNIAEGELEFGGDDLDDVCDGEEDDVVTCGVGDDDNEADAYASAQIKEAKFKITVEGPSGVSEREVVIDLREL